MMRQMQDRGVPANTVTFNSVISACAKNNDLVEAEKWLDDMLKLGCEPTAFTFLPLIGAYANQGNEAKVESYLKEMETRNVPLTQEVYTTLARAWVKQGAEHKLQAMMSDMRQRGVPPSVFLFNSIIEALTAQRRVADAEVQARRLLDEGLTPNQYTYFPIFMCYTAQDDLANAARVFALMESTPGCEPDEGAALHLAAGFVRVGQHTDARALLDRMHKRGKSTRFAASVYCSIAHAFAAAQAPSEAVLVVRDMQARGCVPTVPVMMALAAAWDGAGDAAKWAEAEEWLKAKEVELSTTQMKAMRDAWVAEKRQKTDSSNSSTGSTPSSSNNSTQKRPVQTHAKTQASIRTGVHGAAHARTAGRNDDQGRR